MKMNRSMLKSRQNALVLGLLVRILSEPGCLMFPGREGVSSSRVLPRLSPLTSGRGVSRTADRLGQTTHQHLNQERLRLQISSLIRQVTRKIISLIWVQSLRTQRELSTNYSRGQKIAQANKEMVTRSQNYPQNLYLQITYTSVFAEISNNESYFILFERLIFTC